MYLFTGDYMSHKTEVHPPRTWTKGSVYEKFKKEFNEERGVPLKDIITYAHFLRLWALYLPEYVIRQVNLM